MLRHASDVRSRTADTTMSTYLLRIMYNVTALLAVGMLVAAFVGDVRAQQPEVNPFSESSIELPEIGRLIGPYRKPLRFGHGPEFGRRIWPLGDVNHDRIADWAVSVWRCDTIGLPVEVLLYRGYPGALPTAES